MSEFTATVASICGVTPEDQLWNAHYLSRRLNANLHVGGWGHEMTTQEQSFPSHWKLSLCVAHHRKILGVFFKAVYGGLPLWQFADNVRLNFATACI